MERVIKDINGKVVENAFEKAQYFATKMDMSVEAVISAMETSDCDYDFDNEVLERGFIVSMPKEEEVEDSELHSSLVIEELKEINKRLILEGFEKDKKIERFEEKIEEVFEIRMRVEEENEMLKKELEGWEDIEEADNPPTPEGVMDFIGEMKAHIANVGSENKKLREENEMLKKDMESLDAQNEEKYEKIEELNEEKKELEEVLVKKITEMGEVIMEKKDIEDKLVKALETIIHIKKKGESMCKSWEHIKEQHKHNEEVIDEKNEYIEELEEEKDNWEAEKEDFENDIMDKDQTIEIMEAEYKELKESFEGVLNTRIVEGEPPM